MNREKCRKLREDLNELLKYFSEETGMQVSLVGNSTYNGTSATFKLECAEKDENGEACILEATTFKNRAHEYGLEADMLNKKVALNGKVFEIKGLVPRRRRYPISAVEAISGGSYKLPAEAVKNARIVA